MFESLKNRISAAFGTLRGSKKLSEKSIDEALGQIRRALLEADVALPVAREFIEKIRNRLLTSKVLESLTPEQTVVSIVHEELTEIIGGENKELNISKSKPTVIMIAGLQGSGKTTTAAKLSNLFTQKENKRVLLASVDIYRPAAIDQLRILAEMSGAEFFECDVNLKPERIAKLAVEAAEKDAFDILIVDTAGRLHIDAAMMNEVRSINSVISPHETLFVIDAMIGQDAIVSANAFSESLDLTGIIVTKLDSDTRGGALLSVRQVTGKPVKFIGVGEGIDALETFHPERIASRILGMGDILSLIESVEQKTDTKKAENMGQKIRSGARLDLSDYREQLISLQQVGGMGSVANLMPGMDERVQKKMETTNFDANLDIAIINSMTPGERRRPAIIRASRRARIAKGAGVETRLVNQLLRRYEKQLKMTRKLMRNKGRNAMFEGFEELQRRVKSIDN